MNDHLFIVCLFLLAGLGLMFSRYHYMNSVGAMHWAMMILEVAFVLVIVYTVGVIFWNFPVVNAREILLLFMGLVVFVLGLMAVDDWMTRVDKARMDAERKEKLKIRAGHDERTGSNELV